MKVSRSLIIKAIQTEPLRAGDYIALRMEHDASISYKSAKKAKACEVCAVGAVIVNVLPQTNSIAYLYETAKGSVKLAMSHSLRSLNKDVRHVLKDKDYMSALSMKFEGLMQRRALSKGQYQCNTDMVSVTPGIREKLIEFVKKNFPKSINIKTE